jgi:hypothetical protein
MKKKITALDVKEALLDKRFRESLPASLLPDVQKFLQNTNCACNHPIYQKIMKEGRQQLAAYFPHKDTVDAEKEIDKIARNEWTVFSCHINELQERLRKLAPGGRKQLEVARWQDQVTVVINDLDIAY